MELPVAAPPQEPPRPVPVWPVFALFLATLFGIFLLSMGVFAVGLGVYAARHPGVFRHGLPKTLLEDVTHSPLLLLASLVLTQVVLIAAPLIAVKVSRASAAARLRTGPSSLSFATVAVLCVALVALSESLESVIELTGWSFTFSLKFIEQALAGASPLQMAVLVPLIGVVGPVGEELFFRGYSQTRLVTRWGRWRGIMVAAALFGLLHLDPMHTPIAFVLGLCLGWIAELGGSIRPAMAAHAVNNTLAIMGSRLLHATPSLTRAAWTLGVSLAVFALAVLWVRRPPMRAPSQP